MTVNIDLSVVVATYNRAHLLQETLVALGSQRAPDILKWEIVVVDNNSRDLTAQVVQSFSATTAVPVRYVFEPRQGLSPARNRGIQEARGSILAFTDDDVLPASDWVASIPLALDRWTADGVGGRILPRWELSPPQWLAQSRHLWLHLALMDFEGSRLLGFPLDRWPQVWGANMAFRRTLFEKVGVFDPERGIMGDKLVRGEEVDLITRALERGLKIAYDSSLIVSHRIGPDRLRKGYFRKLSFDDAQQQVRLIPSPTGRTLFGAPLWLYQVVFADLWKYIRCLLLRQPNAFDRQLDWWSSVGRLSGYWKMH